MESKRWKGNSREGWIESNKETVLYKVEFVGEVYGLYYYMSANNNKQYLLLVAYCFNK